MFIAADPGFFKERMPFRAVAFVTGYRSMRSRKKLYPIELDDIPAPGVLGRRPFPKVFIGFRCF